MVLADYAFAFPRRAGNILGAMPRCEWGQAGMENNKVIRGAFQIERAGEGARRSRKTPRRFKMWATTRLARWGRVRERREFLHFTNHCTRSFRIERILIFANLAGVREVKSRSYPRRDNHIKAPPSVQLLPLHRSACTPGRRKNGNELPRNSQAPAESTAAAGNNKRSSQPSMGNDRLSRRIKREDSAHPVFTNYFSCLRYPAWKFRGCFSNWEPGIRAFVILNGV